METRLASREDAASLAALHAESFGDAAWNADQIAGSLAAPAAVTFILVDKGLAQGFITCQFAPGEAEILTFCVSPAARRQGLGQHLLQAALDEARAKGAQRVFLEVAADNDAALTLYRKNNFRINGKRADYYRRANQSVDAIILALDLPV